MNILGKLSLRKNVNKGLPDYYITPTHDFTQFTRDCAEKYWSKEKKFDWDQSVQNNLRENLENLTPAEFSRVVFMTLPMITSNLERKIEQVKHYQLPLEEDVLKDIAECIPFDRPAINQAAVIQLPLKNLQSSGSNSKDELEILQSELLDLREQQRLGLFKEGITVKHMKTEEERQHQILRLSWLIARINQVQEEYKQFITKCKLEEKRLRPVIREAFNIIEPQVLTDLRETRELLHSTLQNKHLPTDPMDIARLKDLIFKRQLRGLKDIANHALVVEQSAIAPLTVGIIHYKRHREIQEAMTTFINDEAKHSATFRRFLVEKLEAKEYISPILIKGANRYMWLARFSPGTGLFLAVVVEAIGAAYLEFFGNEKFMPDKLFCSICKTISVQDETRHMDLCVAMYNELFRKGDTRERFRNNMALKRMMKSVYGDKTEDHHLIQAFRAFGVESEILYQHVFYRLSQQLARISLYIEPEKLLGYIGRS
ncbi:MAG: ferritin-like domain-containing protein [Ginsengibacter sp.]